MDNGAHGLGREKSAEVRVRVCGRVAGGAGGAGGGGSVKVE